MNLRVVKCFLFHFEEMNFLIVVDPSNKLHCYRIRAIYKSEIESLNMYSSLKVDNFRIALFYFKQYTALINDVDCYGNHLIVGFEQSVQLLDRDTGEIHMTCDI